MARSHEHDAATHHEHDALLSLQRHGCAVLAPLGEPLLTALQAEAAALLEQAEAAAGVSRAAEEATARAAASRGCVFQVLPELHAGHPARASAQQYWRLRGCWPCQPAATAFLRAPPAWLRRLLQAALGGSQVLLYNEQYILKPPLTRAASQFAWHFDSQYASGSTGRAVSHSPYLALWVALDAMSRDSGSLVLLPGVRARSGRQDGSSSGGGSTGSCSRCGSSGGGGNGAAAPCAAPALGGEQAAQRATPGCADPSCRQQHTCERQHCCCCGAASAATDPPAACSQQPTYLAVGGPQELLQQLDTMSASQQQCGPVGLLLPPGAAVLFWDDVWHCSAGNASVHMRPAYMAQFSGQPLTWRDTGGLVGLAVPLTA